MSKIDELIAEFCPEGVPKRTVSELFAYEQPTQYLVSSSNYGASGCPVLTAGQTFLLGYTLETDGIFQASENRPVIIFDDFTTAFKWVDFPFKAKSSAMKMIQASSGSSIELRFLFYLMGVLNYRPGQHARHWISVFSNFEIPWPPLEVQREIVSILDKFTQLEAELEAELDARRSQYEHTRDQLLDFSGDLSSHPLRELIAELCPEGVQFYKMADVLQRKKGAPVTAQSMKSLPKGDGSVRVFAGGRTLVDVDSGALAENLVISGPGIIVKSRGIIEFAFWEGLFSHKNELWSYVAKSRKLDLKFAYFYLLTKTEEFRSLARSKSVKMPQLATPDTDEYRIPIPPLEVQHEIVSILDKLDALVNDLTFGLPAEITARRKQYEYYRNQLLTFKELETE
jgi:type I restriction enzyme S subunit